MLTNISIITSFLPTVPTTLQWQWRFCLSSNTSNHGANSVSGAGVLAWLVRGLLCRSEHEAGGHAVLVTGCDTGIGEVMRSLEVMRSCCARARGGAAPGQSGLHRVCWLPQPRQRGQYLSQSEAEQRWRTVNVCYNLSSCTQGAQRLRVEASSRLQLLSLDVSQVVL